MYVVNGIAYAGEREKPVTVICARPLDGYQLQLRFSDGRSGIFDAAELLNQPAFVPLKDKAAFDRVYIDFGVLTWADGEIDIAPEYVYAHTEFLDAEKGA